MAMDNGNSNKKGTGGKMMVLDLAVVRTDWRPWLKLTIRALKDYHIVPNKVALPTICEKN